MTMSSSIYSILKFTISGDDDCDVSDYVWRFICLNGLTGANANYRAYVIDNNTKLVCLLKDKSEPHVEIDKLLDRLQEFNQVYNYDERLVFGDPISGTVLCF
jgi:hypothetical protein